LALTPILLLAPAVYAVLSLIEAIRHVCRSGRTFQLIALPILFWTCHFFYGLGFIVGILLRPILYMLPEKQSEHEIVVRLMTD
jgi:hypothetical protein